MTGSILNTNCQYRKQSRNEHNTYFSFPTTPRLCLLIIIHINIWKGKINCKKTCKEFNSYLKVNTLHSNYKDRSLNAVQGNSLCLLPDSHKIQGVGKLTKFAVSKLAKRK
jgi:hypothetical protein